MKRIDYTNIPGQISLFPSLTATDVPKKTETETPLQDVTKQNTEKHEYSDLRIILRHFRAKELGRSKNPNGSYHRITVGENIFETNIGMIPEDEWEKLAEQAIIDHHDEKLYEAVKGHAKTYCIWLHKDKEIRQYALNCMMGGTWKAWEERGEFKYPEQIG